MPGITGIIGAIDPQKRERILQEMQGMMNCEPFYRLGHCVSGELEMALGWTKMEGSFPAKLPVWNGSKDLCIVFCGEDFPEGQGGSGSSGAVEGSYLAEGYERSGSDFLKRVNGWFCGVVLDFRKREVVLFNDRFGVSRIYFHETQDAFYFSTEAKSLLAVLPETRAWDVRGMGEYLSCGCVLQDRSLFRGLGTLPGASSWVFSPGEAVRKERYFGPAEWEGQSTLEDEEFYRDLRSTWERILPNYWRGGEGTALSLTGGVDSRMILAWTRPEKGELPCYTFCGNYRESNDVKLARELAAFYQQPHRTLVIDDGFFANFGELAEETIRLSDGAMDVTGALDLFMQRAARGVSPVRLSGVYGGEILRRLVAFKPMPVRTDLWNPAIGCAMAEAARTYAVEARGNPVTFSAFKQAPWHMTGKFAVERSQLTFRTPFFDNDLVRLAYRASAGASATSELSLRLIEDGYWPLRGIATDRGLTRGSVGMTNRVRHLWQQFLFKAEYAYDYGMPQWLAALDHGMEWLHLERLFLGRHGPSHFRVWYRDQLADWVKEVLLDPQSLERPYLERRNVEAVVQEHLSGRGNYTLELHKLLSLELIQRQLFAGRSLRGRELAAVS